MYNVLLTRKMHMPIKENWTMLKMRVCVCVYPQFPLCVCVCVDPGSPCWPESGACGNEEELIVSLSLF